METALTFGGTFLIFWETTFASGKIIPPLDCDLALGFSLSDDPFSVCWRVFFSAVGGGGEPFGERVGQDATSAIKTRPKRTSPPAKISCLGKGLETVDWKPKLRLEVAASLWG